jgi:hypothetical protein
MPLLACHLRCATRAELTLAVDPTLWLADSSKLADEIKGHTHRRLAALEGLHVEVVPSLRPGET